MNIVFSKLLCLNKTLSCCVILYLFFINTGTTQNQEIIDSLISVAESFEEDTGKARKYLEHVEVVYLSDPELALEWNKKAIEILEKRKKKSSITEGENQILNEYLSNGYNNMGYFYQNVLSDVELAEEFYKKAIEGHREIGNKKELALALNNLGYFLSEQGKYDNALKIHYEALNIRLALKTLDGGFIDSAGIAMSYMNIGVILVDHGKMDEAMSLYKKSLDWFEELRDNRFIPSLNTNIGYIYYQKGDVPNALDFMHRALKGHENQGNKIEVANSFNSLGTAHLAMKEYEDALLYFEKSITIYDEVGNTLKKSYAIGNMGFLYTVWGNYGKSLALYKECLALNRQNENLRGIATSYNNIGDVYVKMNEPALARCYLDSGLTIYEKIDYPNGIGATYAVLGKTHLIEGNISKAILAAKEAMKIAKDLGSPVRLKEASGILADAFEQGGRYKEALEMKMLYVQMGDSVSNESNKKEAIRQQAKYEYEKAQLIKDQEAKEKRRALIASMQKNRLWAGIIIGCLVLLITAGMVYYAFQKKKNEALFQELRNQALRLQINPHFLFNAMNAISSFIGKNDAVNAKRYLAKFSRIMRLSLESVQSELVTLESEIEFISNYIEIEMIRNKNFEYEIKVDENIPVEDVFIPPILIQPYVENSIVHGFKEKSEEAKGRLQIEFSLVGRDEMKITVEDDGIGIDTKREKIKHKSLALKITQIRLNAFSKKKVAIDFQKAFGGFGTRVSFHAPLKYTMN